MQFIATAILTLALLAPGFARADEIPPTNDPRAAHAATDRNHDGELDREEFHQRMVQNFYFSDSDRDGYVSRGQLKAFDEDELFRVDDLDGDSKISLKEFLDARFDNFRDADTDSDGTLSVEEVVGAFNK